MVRIPHATTRKSTSSPIAAMAATAPSNSQNPAQNMLQSCYWGIICASELLAHE